MSERQASRPAKASHRPVHNIYGEDALWHCHPIWERESFPINGALAQILKRYPDEYHLEFISLTGA